MKCVSHEGDLFDPSGTLTGGSRAAGASVLARLHALSVAEAELETCKAALQGPLPPALARPLGLTRPPPQSRWLRCAAWR